MRLTNLREVAGFVIARAIVIGLLMFGTPYVMSPLYDRLIRAGGAALVGLASLGVGFLAWLVTLLLFILLRGVLGGVPPVVAARRGAVTSSGGEIAAFLIAMVIAMIALSVFSASLLLGLYAPGQDSSRIVLTQSISLAISVGFSALFFLIFIAVRGAMPGAIPAEELDAYDDGGAPKGFGRAIATCLRKYATFRGRASRSEYWYFVLFLILLMVGLTIMARTAPSRVTGALAWLTIFLLFLPGLAVAVRRLHDNDMSGWWVLIAFIPVFGFYMIAWLCEAGTKGPNRFGIGPANEVIPEVFA